MQWHQPWLLMLDREQLEELIDDCRYREASYRKYGNWAMSGAYRGLAHEATERCLELWRQEEEREGIKGQMELAAPEYRRHGPEDGPQAQIDLYMASVGPDDDNAA